MQAEETKAGNAGRTEAAGRRGNDLKNTVKQLKQRHQWRLNLKNHFCTRCGDFPCAPAEPDGVAKPLLRMEQ